MVDGVELICGKCGGVQRPAGSGCARQDGNRFHDGIRNNGGGSGQEAPRYSREYGARLLPRSIRRRPRQGRL